MISFAAANQLEQKWKKKAIESGASYLCKWINLPNFSNLISIYKIVTSHWLNFSLADLAEGKLGQFHIANSLHLEFRIEQIFLISIKSLAYLSSCLTKTDLVNYRSLSSERKRLTMRDLPKLPKNLLCAGMQLCNENPLLI